MMIRALLTAALLTLPMAGTAGAQSMTVTTQNGGTVVKDRSCLRVAGQAECQVATTATSATGQTATRLRSRTTTAGQSTTTVSTTGPNGGTHTRGRNVIITR
jgi:hypothetical protein